MRRKTTLLRRILLALVATFGCVDCHGRGASASQAAELTTATVADASAIAADAGPSAQPPPPAAWVDAVRGERWAEAAMLLEALPEPERARPELRFVAARVASALGKSPEVVRLLDGLDAALPRSVNEVRSMRAEAALEAGPFAVAAEYFASSKRPRDLAKAALAMNRAGDAQAARAVADRAVKAAAKSPRDEALARATRARIGGRSPVAVEDWTWLLVHAPSSPEAAEADAALVTLGARLSAKDLLASIHALLDKGSGKQALDAIERAKKRSDVSRRELDRAHATALYKAHEFAKAARAFQKLAQSGSKTQADDLYYAARSLARSGDPTAALRMHREIARRFPKTVFADRSLLFSGRLLAQQGKYREAADAFAVAIHTLPRGENRADAELEHALALLSSGALANQARRALGGLARAAKSADEAGKLEELEGVAALRAGDKDGAVQIWSAVVRAHPLSWAALLARARLGQVGAVVPPLLEPPADAKSEAPLHPELPDPAAFYFSLGLDREAESALASSERESTASYGDRANEALCGMYGKFATAKRRYRLGASAVTAALLARAPSDADRWAWDCVYPRPYSDDVASLEKQLDLPQGLVHAVTRQESAFDPTIISPAHAVGLMQLMPQTADKLADELSMNRADVELTHGPTNLKLGAHYLRKLLGSFEKSLPLAIAAYNAGPSAVGEWLVGATDLDADVWVARIPFDETRSYVARVLGNLARYEWLAGGDGAVLRLPVELPRAVRPSSDLY